MLEGRHFYPPQNGCKSTVPSKNLHIPTYLCSKYSTEGDAWQQLSWVIGSQHTVLAAVRTADECGTIYRGLQVVHKVWVPRPI